MKNFKQLAAIALFAVSMIGATSSFAAEKVLNGGFESNGGLGSPNATNWTHTGTVANTGITTAPRFSGSFALSIGFGDSNVYSQTITTVLGNWYTFSYAFNGDGASTANSFTSSFGSQAAQTAIFVPDTSLSVPGGMSNTTKVSGIVGSWYVYSKLFQATGASTLISFSINHNSEAESYIGLDAVSVADAPAPVPEIDAVAGAAAITLLLGTMGLVSGRHRRRG
jgi:hypothetical protein